jgi:phosphopentomutase
VSAPPGRRAFVVVSTRAAVGALPDAEAYWRRGHRHPRHLAEAARRPRPPGAAAPRLGSIAPIAGVAPAAEPVLHGRLHPLGPGKDSTTGHWELMGVVAEVAPPTYPDGFPERTSSRSSAGSPGRGVLCNRPYNGIDAIDDFGAEHLETGG